MELDSFDLFEQIEETEGFETLEIRYNGRRTPNWIGNSAEEFYSYEEEDDEYGTYI